MSIDNNGTADSTLSLARGVWKDSFSPRGVVIYIDFVSRGEVDARVTEGVQCIKIVKGKGRWSISYGRIIQFWNCVVELSAKI